MLLPLSTRPPSAANGFVGHVGRVSSDSSASSPDHLIMMYHVNAQGVDECMINVAYMTMMMMIFSFALIKRLWDSVKMKVVQ